MSALRMVRAEDLEEARLAEVDQDFMDYFGPDWARWRPWQQEQYLAAIEQVHAEFAPQQGQVAA
ncbi:hypothetical protein CFC35_05440 [Streptomyces sp. FBKL.4005]|uniref:Uncharacterized protein n=1 Tax=Streptomyces tricolor TaxID=68277 RepID=A0ABS9JLU6_9ACTN|nr:MULTISPECIES: hypothetical protein [Streptomyces]MCG0066536.1 hypothetical protein [Streptomyces tricolor]OYP14008.1 hypothetical protein CFC35_05440 [Streptomyces sp. FBKL.4005]